MGAGKDNKSSKNVFELIQTLGSKGIKLWVEKGGLEKRGLEKGGLEEPELKFKAPKGALTKALRAELAANKAEVIAFLSKVQQGQTSDQASIPLVSRTRDGDDSNINGDINGNINSQYKNEFRLSFAQQRLWFIDQFEPDSSAYNIPAALYLKGDLDVEALRRSFETIVQRHESLRTTFNSVDGGAIQIVHEGVLGDDALAWPLPVVDLTGLHSREREVEALKKAQHEIEKPFDLIDGPLFRTRLLKLAENRYALLATLHHIVSDAWSLDVLIEELAVLYACFRENPLAESPLPALSIQYVDFAEWQRNELKDAVLEKQLAYWKTHLRGAPALLTLPTDRPRPPVQTKSGAHYPITLAPELVAKLKGLAGEQGATLYMVLMAAFKVLLSRYSQQQDITVGLPIAGRNRIEIEPLIGFFVNSLVTRTRFDDNPTIAELIERERISMLGAYAHQDVPFEAVVDALDLDRDMSYAPVRQAAFTLTQTAGTKRDAILEGIEIEQMGVSLNTAKVDVSLLLQMQTVPEAQEPSITGGVDLATVSGSIEYNTDLFDVATVQEWSQHFQRILTCFVLDYEQSVNGIALYSEAELLNLLQLGDECVAIQPLTPMQRDFYLLAITQPESLAGSLGYAIHLHQRLDEQQWRSALQQVSDHYSALRLKYVKTNNPAMESVYQAVQRTVEVECPLIDLTNLGIHDANHKDLRKTIEEFVHRPYRVDLDPLVRYALIKVSERYFVPLLACHHGVLDGKSESQHLRHVLAVYEKLSAGENIALDGEGVLPPDQFLDFVPAIRAKTDSSAVNRFWVERLSDVEPILARIKSDAGQLQQHHLALDAEHCQKIKSYCQHHSLSKANYFKCLFSLLVAEYHRVGGDFIIGEVTAGRSEYHQDDLGCFIQVIPFVVNQANLTADDSVVDYFQAARQARKSLGDNQSLSLLRLSQLTAKSELQFQVNYRLASATSPYSLMGKEAEIEFVTPEGEGVVKLVTTERHQGLDVGLHFHDGQFDDLNLLKRLESVSKQVLEGAKRIGDINYLLEGERNDLLIGRNRPPEPYEPSSVISQMSQMATERESEIAVIFQDRRITYGELNVVSDGVARLLIAKGVSRGAIVGVCVERSIEMIIALLGILKSGAAYLPLDAEYPETRLAHMLTDSNTRIVVTQEGVLTQLPDTSIELMMIENLIADLQTTANAGLDWSPLPTVLPNDPAYLIYTSGSTGDPKGVLSEHRNLHHYVRAATELYKIGHEDVVLQFSSLSFDASIEEIFPTLCAGAQLVIRDEAMLGDAESFFNALQTYGVRGRGISVVGLPTAYWHELVGQFTDEVSLLVKQLRLMIIGGERVLPQRVSEWQKWIGDSVCLMNTYGPTETTVVATAADLTHITVGAGEIPIGKPLANVQCYIVDERMHPVPAGIEGELCISGGGVTRGYFGNEAQTVSAFIPNPFSDGPLYRTGDLVRYGGDGQIEYRGRLDTQVKIRGFRIELSEIELMLSHVDCVQDNVVIAVDDQGHDLARDLNIGSSNKLVAFVVLKSEVHKNSSSRQEDSVASIRAQLKERLPDYMMPSGFVLLDEIPKSPSGKTDRKSVKQWLHLDDTGTEYIAPRTQTEKTLEAIWKGVLGLQQVSITANFFDLGGHSLLATQVIARLRDALHVELPLRQLFEHPTIETMARAVAVAIETRMLDSAPIIIALAPELRKQPSFAQHRLWFIDQLDPGQSTYNIPVAVKITGNLQPRILSNVFQEIVTRHEVLRTNFIEREDELELVELVLQECPEWELPVVDLSALTAVKQSSETQCWVEQDAATPFDLTSDMLLRTRLLKLSDREYVLIICLHHIACDGWSIGVMINEVIQLYQAFNSNQPSPLAPPAIQYADFAYWQRQWLSGEVLQKQLDYWLEQLRGAPGVLRLPTDRPRPAQQTFNGAHLAIRMDQALTEEIHHFCQQQAVTPFVLLMSAYQLLLSRYCSQEDVCVGIPIAGRNRVAIENLMGYFINGLVIRTDLSGNPSVTSLIDRVREVALGAFSHQDMPADLLVDALQMERSQGFSPGAQVGFAWQNTPQKKWRGEVGDLLIEGVEREHKTAKYEMSLILAEDTGGIAGVVEYNTDLFDVETIERLIGHYHHVLRTMMHAPDKSINNISLLDQEELRKLLKVSEACEIRRLTAKQRDFYLDSLVSKRYGQNCMGYSVELKTEQFDLGLWKKALGHIASTQTLMRTHIVEADAPYADVAYQVVDPDVCIEVEYEDCSHHHLNDEQIHAWVNKRVQRPWPFSGKLMAYHVLKVDSGVYQVALSGHHMLLDGVGFALHGLAAVEAYSLLLEGKECPVATDHFGDYINENREKFDTVDMITFWRKRLSKVQALHFSLPPEVSASSVETLNSASERDDQGEKNTEVEHYLDPELWQSIQRYCKKNSTSPALFFKAIYGLLVNAYCDAEADFTITEFAAGRSRQHLNMLGCYFQSLPFVFDQRLFDADSSFIEICRYARQFAKQSRDNEFISDLEQRRILPESRLSFMYNFYHFLPSFEFMRESARSQHYVPDLRGPVQLVVSLKDEGLGLKLSYLPSLFTDLEFLQRIELVARQVVGAVDAVGELRYLLPAEESKLEKLNNTARDLDAEITLVTVFEKQVLKTPDAIALISGDQRLTYRELNEKINRFAHYLAEKEIKSGCRVGICLELGNQDNHGFDKDRLDDLSIQRGAKNKGTDLVIAILAVIKTGAAYVPIDSSYPTGRIQHIIDDAQLSLLITKGCVLQRLGDGLSEATDEVKQSTMLLCLDEKWPVIDNCASHNLDLAIKTNDLLYVIYTSGSTGEPKGVGVTHGGENNLQAWYDRELGIAAEDRCLLVSSIGFDLTQKNLFALLLHGGTLVIPETTYYDPHGIVQEIEKHQITHINCAPSVFYPLQEEEANFPMLSSLRAVVLGGEPVQLSKLNHWLLSPHCQCEVMNSYGPTECTDVVAFHWLTKASGETLNPQEIIPIGKAIDNTQLVVLDRNNVQVPFGVTGELCIAGAGVGLGYLNRQALTASTFIDNPYGSGLLYKTGDLVRYRLDGDLEYIGRRDFQVKLRGLRIELGEIEYSLRQQEGISDALVVLKDEQLIAYVVSDNTPSQSQLALSKWKHELQKLLPEYMIPHHIVELDAWPLTPNGKIDRSALPERERNAMLDYVGPRNEIEEKLAEIWCDVLGLDKVSVHDDFFRLGGHSLLAARAASKFRRCFKVDIPLRALFELHTIAEISEYISTLKWAVESADKSNEIDDRGEGRIEGLL